jgi:hypothetical protein
VVDRLPEQFERPDVIGTGDMLLFPGSQGIAGAGVGEIPDGHRWEAPPKRTLPPGADAVERAPVLGIIGGGRCRGIIGSIIIRRLARPSGLHQLFLLLLTVGVFLLEVVPLELQRRIINDLVKHRDYRLVIVLCVVYAGTVLVQGAPSSSSTSIAAGSASAQPAISVDGMRRRGS